MNIPVKVVAHKGNSALIEYIEEGQTERRVVPFSSVKNDTVDANTIKSGAPYGVSLSGLHLNTAGFPHRLEQECRRIGLWTREDFLKNPALVQSALASVLGIDTATILNLVAANE